MNKSPIFWLVVAIALVALAAGLSVINDGVTAHRYAIALLTSSAGRELIATTNSTGLTKVSPALRAELADLLASTTYVANVYLGDEPPPLGDGRACSRLVLTNEHGDGLSLRLQEEPRSGVHSSGRFRVLSYWKITEPNSPEIRLGTNQTSATTGSHP